jgi:DNA primase
VGLLTMSAYASDSRDRVRDAVDFVQLVSARTELRRAGPGRYEGLCPFHEERTPSFGIDPVRKLYHCFGCGASGDVFTFVQETEGVDFRRALELLAEQYGVELKPLDEDPRAAERRRERDRVLELLDRAAAFYERCLWSLPDAASAREHLAQRGLREQVLREHRVGFAPDGRDTLLEISRQHGFSARELERAGLAQRGAAGAGSPYDRFRGRIMFPLADLRGRVLGFGARALSAEQGPKYLNSAENEVYHKGRHLYGAHIARADSARTGEVIVCEGYTDVIALHQAGIRNAVGLMGTALTAAQVDELARLAPKVLLALDADSAGQEAMLRASRLAAGKRIELYVVRLPAGEGDADDAAATGIDPAELVQREGAETMRAAVRGAVPFMRFRVERVLARGDHASASGRDRMLDELREIFALIPQSAMHMSLLRLVSGRLALSERLAETLLAAPSGKRGSRGGRGRGRSEISSGMHRARARTRAVHAKRGVAGTPGSVAGDRGGRVTPPGGRRDSAGPARERPPAHGEVKPGVTGAQRAAADVQSPVGERPVAEERPAAGGALSRRERLERAFLALCIAFPKEGARALAEVTPEEHFTADALCRAAAHLRAGGLENPMRGVGERDRELERVLAELLAQAGALAGAPAASGAPGQAEPADRTGAPEQPGAQDGEVDSLAWARHGAAQLEVQRLQLELARLERLIQTARARRLGALGADAGGAPAGAGSRAPDASPPREGVSTQGAVSVSELAARREQVKRAFDRAQQQALETTGAQFT